VFVFFSQQTTTHPYPDARLDRQHPEKLIFVVGDGEETGGLWVLLMVIFVLFVTFFLVLFVSLRSSWCLLMFFAHSRPNEYFWSGYFRRSVAWVFSQALAGSRQRVGRRSSADLAGYTGPFSRSSEIYVRILISYTILGRKKKEEEEEEEEKNRYRFVLFFFLFFF